MIAFTWREESCFKASPALKSWLDSWSHPWSSVPTSPLVVAFGVLATVLITASKGDKSLTWYRIEMNRILSKSSTKSCNFYVPVRLKTSVNQMVDLLSHGIFSWNNIIFLSSGLGLGYNQLSMWQGRGQ